MSQPLINEKAVWRTFHNLQAKFPNLSPERIRQWVYMYVTTGYEPSVDDGVEVLADYLREAGWDDSWPNRLVMLTLAHSQQMEAHGVSFTVTAEGGEFIVTVKFPAGAETDQVVVRQKAGRFLLEWPNIATGTYSDIDAAAAELFRIYKVSRRGMN